MVERGGLGVGKPGFIRVGLRGFKMLDKFRAAHVLEVNKRMNGIIDDPDNVFLRCLLGVRQPEFFISPGDDLIADLELPAFFQRIELFSDLGAQSCFINIDDGLHFAPGDQQRAIAAGEPDGVLHVVFVRIGGSADAGLFIEAGHGGIFIGFTQAAFDLFQKFIELVLVETFIIRFVLLNGDGAILFGVGVGIFVISHVLKDIGFPAVRISDGQRAAIFVKIPFVAGGKVGLFRVLLLFLGDGPAHHGKAVAGDDIAFAQTSPEIVGKFLIGRIGELVGAAVLQGVFFQILDAVDLNIFHTVFDDVLRQSLEVAADAGNLPGGDGGAFLMETGPNDRRAGNIRRAVDGILAFGCIVSGVARTYGRVVYGVFVTILPVGVFVFVAPFFGGRTDFTGILIALELGLQLGFFLRGKMLVFADGVSQRVENGFCFCGFFCLFCGVFVRRRPIGAAGLGELDGHLDRFQQFLFFTDRQFVAVLVEDLAVFSVIALVPAQQVADLVRAQAGKIADRLAGGLVKGDLVGLVTLGDGVAGQRAVGVAVFLHLAGVRLGEQLGKVNGNIGRGVRDVFVLQIDFGVAALDFGVGLDVLTALQLLLFHADGQGGGRRRFHRRADDAVDRGAFADLAAVFVIDWFGAGQLIAAVGGHIGLFQVQELCNILGRHLFPLRRGRLAQGHLAGVFAGFGKAGDLVAVDAARVGTPLQAVFVFFAQHIFGRDVFQLVFGVGVVGIGGGAGVTRAGGGGHGGLLGDAGCGNGGAAVGILANDIAAGDGAAGGGLGGAAKFGLALFGFADLPAGFAGLLVFPGGVEHIAGLGGGGARGGAFGVVDLHVIGVGLRAESRGLDVCIRLGVCRGLRGERFRVRGGIGRAAGAVFGGRVLVLEVEISRSLRRAAGLGCICQQGLCGDTSRQRHGHCCKFKLFVCHDLPISFLIAKGMKAL